MASESEEAVPMEEEPATPAPPIETDITVNCSSEYPDYSYNSAHDIWTLVSLKAPCQVPVVSSGVSWVG